MTDKEERLKKIDSNKLIDVVKNYRQYGYDESLRNFAITLLGERGISKEQLELTGNFINRNYDFVEDVYKSFSKNSRIAFILYSVAIISYLALFVMPALFVLLVYLGALVLYFVFLILSFISQNKFYKLIGQDYGAEGALIYFFLGMPLYIFMYFIFRNQMRDKMTLVK